MYTWGARDEELTAPRPGGELVTGDTIRTTGALTVDAPASYVWPWLAQIGEDRGGSAEDPWGASGSTPRTSSWSRR